MLGNMISRPILILFILLVVLPAVLGIKKWAEWRMKTKLDAVHRMVLGVLFAPLLVSVLAFPVYLFLRS